MTEPWKIIGTEFISYYGGNAHLIGNGDFKFHVWEHPDDVGKVVDLLNSKERKIERLEQLNEHKKKEIQARVKALNEVCDKYFKEVTFKNDVNPNEAVQIVIKEILETHFEV